MAKKVPKRYTLGEEIFSSVTHGIGSLLAIGGTAVLIVLAAIYSDAWSVVGCAIFGASLIVLYCMSTLYHAITNPKAKSFFRIMDHNTIFFLIAGTYTPITISILRGAIGWVLFGIVVVEDLISTAGSCIEVVEALREAGAEVLGIASIFTYGMRKGLDRLAEAKVKNVSLTNLDAVAKVAAETGYINPDDVARLLKFRDNPSDESWIGGNA